MGTGYFNRDVPRDVQVLRKQLMDLQKALEQRESLLDKKEQRLEEFEHELGMAQKASQAKVQQSQQQVLARVAKAQRDLPHLQQQIAEHKKAIEMIRKQKGSLLSESKQIQEFYEEFRAHQQQFADMKRRLADAQASIVAAERRLEQKRSEFERLDAQSREAERRHMSSEHRLEDLQKKREEIAQAFKQEQSRFEDLKRRSDVLDEVLEKKRVSFESELSKRKGSIESELQQKKAQIEKQLADQKRSIEDELASRRGELDRQVAQKEQKIQSYIQARQKRADEQIASRLEQAEAQLQHKRAKFEDDLRREREQVHESLRKGEKDMRLQLKELEHQRSTFESARQQMLEELKEKKSALETQYRQKTEALKQGAQEKMGSIDQVIAQERKKLIDSLSLQKSQIESLKKEASRQEHRLAEHAQQVDHKEALLKRKEEILSKKEDGLSQAEKELEKTVDDISHLKQRTEKEVAQLKSQALSDLTEQRETLARELVRVQKEIPQKLEELKSRRLDVQSAIQVLEEKKASFEQLKIESGNFAPQIQQMQKAKEELLVLRGTLSRKEEALKQSEQDLAERIKFVESRERRIDEEIKKGARSNVELIEKKEKESLATIKRRIDELAQREKALVDMRGGWEDKQAQLRGQIDMLTNLSAQLRQQVQGAKTELEAVNKQWQDKSSALLNLQHEIEEKADQLKELQQGDLALLKEKEVELLERVRDLEEDQDTLYGEEKSVVKKTQELEKSLSRFTKEDQRLKAWQQELDQQQRQQSELSKALKKDSERLEKFKGKLDMQSEQIKRARTLRSLLPKLEQKLDKVKGVLGKAEAKAIHATLEPLVKREALKDLQSDVASREKALESREDYLEQLEEDIENKRKGLLEQEDATIISTMAQELAEEKEAAVTPDQDPQLYGLLNQARAALRRKDLNKAIRFAVEAELLASKMESDRKQLVSYDVQQLKTEIKLAALEQ